MRVLSVASEAFPLIKTGGLADVVGALPLALAKEHVEVRTLLPGYSSVVAALRDDTVVVSEIDDCFGGAARLLLATSNSLVLFVLDAPHLFRRMGGPYTAPDGLDWTDNHRRFGALCRVGAMLAQGRLGSWRPDVVHAHDWQAGLVPAYLHFGASPSVPTVVTVHNMAFQGRFPATTADELGFPPSAFTMEGIEFYGDVGFLKAGLRFADRITTVSPTYAHEITEPAGGMGLEGLISARASDVSGILNGIDVDIWNPGADPLLPARFSSDDLAQRSNNRKVLQQRLGLANDQKAVLFGVVSRLTEQKGVDLILEVLPELVAMGGQLALIGTGPPEVENAFQSAAVEYLGYVGTWFGYNEELAHLLQGGVDSLLVPSRFEPCGLTQLCALRYGAIPVVARTGGLNDTVIDASPVALAAGVATGIQFAPVTPRNLVAAIRRAIALYGEQEHWQRMQRNGMRTDVSWAGPARQYATLFRALARQQ